MIGVALVWLLAQADAGPPPVELWAGHMVMRGKRHVPLSGEAATQTENFVLAEVRRTGGGLEMRQHFCRTETLPINGVTVTMSKEAVARLPAWTTSLRIEGEQVRMSNWVVAWGNEDLDRDGHPGATFTVGNTVCSGDLYLANQSRYFVETARLDERGHLAGGFRVEHQQRVLGAAGLCLKAMASDSADTQRGAFAYAPVPAGTTCASLAGKPWPVRAALPAR